VLIIAACLWSSLGPFTTSGLLSSTFSAVGTQIEEMLENIVLNYTNLIEKLNSS
jgi:hypothetical protein